MYLKDIIIYFEVLNNMRPNMIPTNVCGVWCNSQV